MTTNIRHSSNPAAIRVHAISVLSALTVAGLASATGATAQAFTASKDVVRSATRPVCQPTELQGLAVLGFEASYVVPSKGKLKNRKIWLPDSNAVSNHFNRIGVPRAMWRRASVKMSGCSMKGHFGHLSAYRYQLLNVRIHV